jgi:hypothetical protein
MSTWTNLEFNGKTMGVWECGSRLRSSSKKICETSGGHRQIDWDFKKKHQRRFGRGFRAAINRMPLSEYKKMILEIVEQFHRHRGKLSEKQWKYLGLLMTKADPACLHNPKVLIKIKKNKTKSAPPGTYIKTRKKGEAL